MFGQQLRLNNDIPPYGKHRGPAFPQAVHGNTDLIICVLIKGCGH